MMAYDKTGWVYFIECRDTKNIKIGWANNPSIRMANLQTSTASILRLVAVMPGCRKVERQVHNTHAASHIRGEWYRPDHAILCRIEGARAQYGQPWESPPSPTTLDRITARLQKLYDDVLAGTRVASDSNESSKYKHVWQAIIAERGGMDQFVAQSTVNRAIYQRKAKALQKAWRDALERGEDPPHWRRGLEEEMARRVNRERAERVRELG